MPATLAAEHPSPASAQCFLHGCRKDTYHFVGSGGGGGGGYGLTLRDDVEVSPLYLLGLLNSRLLDWTVKLGNSRFGQGYYSFNRQYIAPLPIRLPDMSDRRQRAEHDQLVELVGRLVSLYERRPAASASEAKVVSQRIAATEAQIDRLVYAFYRLTDDEIAVVERESREP